VIYSHRREPAGVAGSRMRIHLGRHHDAVWARKWYMNGCAG